MRISCTLAEHWISTSNAQPVSILMKSSTLTNPCLECAQCCQHFRVTFYHGQVSGNGYGTVPPELVTSISPHLVCMKGTEQGRHPCIALKYWPQMGYRCSIYENRPSPCREFNCHDERGIVNPKCNALRMAVDLKPLSDLAPQYIGV